MRRWAVARDLEKQLSGKRITIGVKPCGGKSEQHVARIDAFAVNHLLFIHDTDDKARDIVFAFRIKAGHLSRLAAQKHAAILAATIGHTLDYRRDRLRLEAARRNVV